MHISHSTSIRELAFIVCTALDRQGTKAVLTGGGAASIYTSEAYESRDLDFVLSFAGSQKVDALIELGFCLRGQHYEHPQTIFTIDFPPGPLIIGDVPIDYWDTLIDRDYLLHIIKPTDSMLDRFAAYVHWKDRGSLRSAALVANAINESLDWKRIEDWCKSEEVTWAIPHLQEEIKRLKENTHS